jgi:phosphoribosylanthranilate isomerase
MTEIKICGITRIEDALCAASLGVDAVGFIFHEPSPRNIAPERAREIISVLPRTVATVGIFVNRGAEEVLRTAAECGLDLIQLHGDESPDYCRSFQPGRLIKAVSCRTAAEVEALGTYEVRALLLDARDGDRYGGTGKRVDWELAAELARRRPLILAGGLTPENITEALSAVAPAAVDINSGIELAPGIKDREAMKRIVGLIRNHKKAQKGDGSIFFRAAPNPGTRERKNNPYEQ